MRCLGLRSIWLRRCCSCGRPTLCRCDCLFAPHHLLLDTFLGRLSPVWWFRCTPALESFFDQIFTPGFAYKFKPITKVYGIPQPLLGDKQVRTYLTHGAPALPVLTLYLNSVKLRLVLGVYSFVFGWFKTKTRQFWSVPFVSQKKREEYLNRVKKDIRQDIK